MKTREFFGGTVGVLFSAVLLAVVLLHSSHAPAAPPIVHWDPSDIVQHVNAGETITTAAFFTASKNLSNVVVSVVPELAPYVHVTPSSYESIAKGETYEIGLTMLVPIDALMGAYDGTIQMRSAEGKNVYAKPLPVKMEVTWPAYESETAGISFFYPTFAQQINVVSLENPDGVFVFDFVVITPDERGGFNNNSQYLMELRRNETPLLLAQWFQDNVDSGGLLLSTGTFVPTVLDNGIEAYVLRTGVPNEYDGPAIPGTIYAVSPDGMTIITIFKSHDNALGISDSASVTDSLLAMLATLDLQ